MENDTKKIARHTGIYTVGTVLRNLATFLMLPIYTRYLTPGDYGIIELLSMIIDLFAIIFGLKIGDAVFRYHSRYEHRRDKNQVITTALVLTGGLTLMGFLVIVASADYLSLLVFKDVTYAGQLSLFAMTLPLAALAEIAFLYLRAEGRPWLFVAFSTLRLLLQLGLNIYFVVVQKWEVDGVIYSAVISYSVMALVMLAFTIRRTGISTSRRKAAELALFSWPLILAAIATFYMTVGNRYFLQLYTGPSQVGIYSLGYRFGFLLLVFAWGPFSAVWDASRFAIAKKANASAEFRSLFTLVSTALIGFALGIAIFVKDVLMLMSDPQFWAASSVVPIILIAYIFQAWTGYSKLGILLSGKTIQMAFATAFACIFMTLGCLLLIPSFGGMGAATAVLLGFVVRFAWVYHVSKRHYDMHLDWLKVSKIGSLAFVVYGFSTLAPEVLSASIAIHAVQFIAFVFLLFSLPILSSKEREAIIGFARNFIGMRPAVMRRVE